MRNFGTADCETDPFSHGRIPKPFIWGYYNERDGFHYFFETKDFVEFIKTRKEIIYFHNGGKFDLHFLFEYIEPQENIMVINGRLAKIKIGECELRDSFLLLPVPLSAYKKDEIDYTKFEAKNRKKHMAEIHAYLKADCVYLYEILSKNFELYGQKLSLASSAFDFWFKKFANQDYKPKSSPQFFDEFKKYYYGGRVECFKKGIINFPFKVYDIRSAYPRAMLEEHPYGTEYSTGTKIPDKNIEQCFIHFRGRSDGALPSRGEGLNFPRDKVTRDYFATGWEVKAGLENGTIKIDRVLRVAQFRDTINFRNYVEYFYKEKEAQRGKDGAAYLLAKLYLNSLYGKFGQNSNDHLNYELIEPQYIEAYIEENYKFVSLIGKYALMATAARDDKKIFYNVATAASITGYVRAALHREIINSKQPLYCDTDSLAVVQFSGIVGEAIGEWECEGEFQRGAIAGKKLYAFLGEKGKEKISSKGVKLTAKEIFSIAKGSVIEYKNNAPTFSMGKKASFIKRKVRMT